MRLKRILPFGLCLLGLLAVHLAIFHDHWLGRTWFPYDFPAGYYGIVAYWVTSLQSGEWPQWIPYQSMGYPLLMNPQSGFFYPPFWIFVVLRIPFTLHAAVIVQILHVLFGSIGVLLLANELFGSWLAAECGAVAFLFFGGFYTNAEHADIIRGFAWAPWLLWAARLRESRWRLQNLFLPLFVACYITGAYTGQVIGGLFLLAVFVVVQAFTLWPVEFAWRILCKHFALIAVGVLMAAAFLLTGAALAEGLTRSRNVHSLHLTWLTGKALFDLVFPSNLIHPVEDYSMFGMQIPVVLLLFLPLIEMRFLKRLVPLLAVAAAASFLSFQALAPASDLVRHLLPVFALSRFPAADYRVFVYLAVLMAATGGVASVLRGQLSAWKVFGLGMFVAALFGLLVLACVQHDVAPPLIKQFLNLGKRDTLIMLAAALLLAASTRWGRPAAAVLLILPVLAFVSFPVIDAEQQFWVDSGLLKNVYDGRGFPLMVQGRLRTAAIFARSKRGRGPRLIADNVHVLSWWGYLDGAYLTNDSGGVIPLARTAVESNPALMKFILGPSELLATPCQADHRVCNVPDPVLDISNKTEVGTPVQYGRNVVEYQVNVPVRSLVVENEIAIRGWSVTIDGQPEAVRTVDGCLRGWIVPPGKHRAILRYQTPYLISGLLLSAGGLTLWIALVWIFSTGKPAGTRDWLFAMKSVKGMEPPSELESETSSLPMRCSTN